MLGERVRKMKHFEMLFDELEHYPVTRYLKLKLDLVGKNSKFKIRKFLSLYT